MQIKIEEIPQEPEGRSQLAKVLKQRRERIEMWEAHEITVLLLDNARETYRTTYRKLRTCAPEEVKNIQSELNALEIVLEWPRLQKNAIDTVLSALEQFVDRAELSKPARA